MYDYLPETPTTKPVAQEVDKALGKLPYNAFDGLMEGFGGRRFVRNPGNPLQITADGRFVAKGLAVDEWGNSQVVCLGGTIREDSLVLSVAECGGSASMPNSHGEAIRKAWDAVETACMAERLGDSDPFTIPVSRKDVEEALTLSRDAEKRFPHERQPWLLWGSNEIVRLLMNGRAGVRLHAMESRPAELGPIPEGKDALEAMRFFMDATKNPWVSWKLEFHPHRALEGLSELAFERFVGGMADTYRYMEERFPGMRRGKPPKQWGAPVQKVVVPFPQGRDHVATLASAEAVEVDEGTGYGLR